MTQTAAPTREGDRARLVQQGLVALVQVLALTVWFSASAVVPTLRQDWGISADAAVWLTASVQVGFVVGALTSTVLNLADRVSPPRLMACGAFAATGFTVLVASLSHGLASAIPLRFLTGVALAAVYPVGMKLMASWAPPATRGRAFGVLIGALTLGSALPHLISASALPWRGIMLAAAAVGLLGAVVAATVVRPGPLLAPTAALARPRYAMEMFRERGPRLANLGYFGHMWELYALWTWVATWLLAGRPGLDDTAVGLLTFVAVGLAGLAGCLAGGWSSDRFGRPRTAFVALVLSGSCCLLSPLVYGGPLWLVGALLLVWGASVIADSGVFSTALSEVADERYVGTALSAQTAIGFLITVVTIQLVPLVAGAVGWQLAFLALAPGPLVGALAMRAFGRNAPA